MKRRTVLHKPPTLLDRFRRWARVREADELSYPRTQKFVLLFLVLILSPLLIISVMIWLPFSDEFSDLSLGKRILFWLSIPFLTPTAYFYVFWTDVATPLAERIAHRWRAMREAKAAVKRLLRDSLG